MVRIISSNMPDGDQLHRSSQVSSSSKRQRIPLSPSSQASESLKSSLSDFYNRSTINVLDSQLQAIESKLAAIGISQSDVDVEIALRSLVMHNNNIPFSRTLLIADFENEPTLFASLTTLKEHALSLLSDNRVAVEIKPLIDTLVRQIDSYFTSGQNRTIEISVEKEVAQWFRQLESQLLTMFNSSPENAEKILTAGSNQSMASPGNLIHLYESISDDAAARTFLERLSVLATELRNGLLGQPLNSVDTREWIAQILMNYENSFGALAAEFEAVLLSGASEGALKGLAAGFISEMFNDLRTRLIEKAAGAFATSDPLIPFGDHGDGIPLGEIIRRSGMQFEWRLLAWYGAGGNPDRLHEFIQHDVKWMLNTFIAGLGKKDQGGKSALVDDLDKDVQALLGRLTSRQVFNTLQGPDDRRHLYFEVPFGDAQDRSFAHIRARGRQKNDESTLDSDNFELTFDIETNNLGRVFVSMNVVKKTVSVRFRLQEPQFVDQADDMQRELIDALVSKGFTFGAFSAHCDDGDEKSETHRKQNGMDVVG